MGLRQVLEVDTKSFCLICLSSTASSVSSFQNRLLTLKGFKQFLRFLNVNPKDLFNCSSVFLESMNMMEDVDVKINLCCGCSSVMNKFDKLHKEYEVIMHQFDNCVHSVYKLMKQGDEDSERVREYKKEMLPKKSAEFVNASIAANLRNETYKKCASKLKSRGPRVALQNIGLQSVPVPSPFIPRNVSTTGHTRIETQHAFSEPYYLDNPTENGIINPLVEVARPATTTSDIVDEPSRDEMEIPANICHDDNDDDLDTGGSEVLDTESRNVPEKISTVCEFCTQLFGTNELKSRHQLSVHSHDLICQALPTGASKYLIATATETTFVDILNNVDEFGFRCSFCSQSLSNKNTTRLHVLSHHFNEFLAQIEVYLGQENTESPDPLSSVVDFETGVQQDNPTPSSSSARSRSTSSNHACDICPRSFLSKAELNMHRATHSIFNKNPDTHRFKCQHCDYSTNRAANLRYHCLHMHLNYVISNALPSTYSKIRCTQVIQDMVNEISNYGKQCPWCVCTSTNLKSHLLGSHFNEFVQEVRSHLDADNQEGADHGSLEQPEYPIVQLNERAHNAMDYDDDAT